jgi:hypothetical protein
MLIWAHITLEWRVHVHSLLAAELVSIVTTAGFAVCLLLVVLPLC